MLKNIFLNFNRKRVIWTKERCPTCGSLLFEKDVNSFKKGTVRVKCRKCKKVQEI